MQDLVDSKEKESELVIDFTKPVLDLSYEGLTIVAPPKVTGDKVKALILCGNPLQELDFVLRFSRLELLQLDGVGLRDFYELPLGRFPHLKHLILRINNLTGFQYLEGSQTLQSLDISQNYFDFNAEKSLTTAFPGLCSVQFGFSSAKNDALCYATLSETRIETLGFFQRLFFQRGFQSSIIEENTLQSYVELGNYSFNGTIEGNQLLFNVEAAGGRVKNSQVTLKAYSVLYGFQIKMLQTLELRVADFAREIDLNIHELFAGSESIVSYPTDSCLRDLDLDAVNLVASNMKKQIQNNELQPDCWAVSIEICGQVGVFFIKPSDNEFLDAQKIQKKLQLQIDGQRGVNFSIKYAPQQKKLKDVTRTFQEPHKNPSNEEQHIEQLYAGPGAPTSQIMSKTRDSIILVSRNFTEIEVPLFVENPVKFRTQGQYSFAYYYVSMQSYSELLEEVQEMILTLSDIEISVQSAARLIKEGIRLFNSLQSDSQGQSVTKSSILVPLSFSNQKTPLKINLQKVYVGDPENEYTPPLGTQQKLLAVQLFYRESCATLLAGPIRVSPHDLNMTLQLNDGNVECFVYQRMPSGEKLLCDNNDFQYTFILDNDEIQVNAGPICQLQGGGRYSVEVFWPGEEINIGKCEITIQ